MREKLYVSPKIVVKDSPLHGRGVFAEKPLARGELIEECHFAIVDSPLAIADERLNAYLFTWPRGSRTTLAMVFGFAMVYNHSDEPNITWETDEAARLYRFIALRDIAAGEELCHRYGPHATGDIQRRQAAHAATGPLRLTFELQQGQIADQVEALARAGVHSVEVDLGTLHDGLLESLGRERGAIERLTLLREAAARDIDVRYDLYVSIPGEEARHCLELAALVPFLVHLPAPRRLVPLEEAAPGPELARARRCLAGAVARWMDRRAACTAICLDPDGPALMVLDRRGLSEVRTILAGAARDLYRCLGQGPSRAFLAERLAWIDPAVLSCVLSVWTARGWICTGSADRRLALLPRISRASKVAESKNG